jgi:sn-glycerol 3-phosphate transport system substrate-binding protein
MKRIFLMLAILLWVCSVCVAEPVKLTLWHSMTQDAGQLMDAFVKEFNETLGREQGIEVEAVFQGKYSEAVTKLNSVLSSGQTDTLPDVMQLDATGKVSFASAASAYSVDRALQEHPEADLSDLLAPALANWKLGGVQLGLPFATSTTVLYYNKSAFDALGLTVPGTLEGIASLAGSGLEKDGEASRTVFACLPNTPTLANWLGQLGSNLVNRTNGTEGTASALECVDNGALLEFLRAWKALYESGVLENGEGSLDAFVAGKQLMMISSSSNVASVLEKIGDSFELGVTFYPRVSETAAQGATVNGSCLVIFDQGEARRNAAWTFVTFMTGPEVQAAFARGTGYLPSNVKASDSSAWTELVRQYPQYEVGLSQVLQTPDTMHSVTVGPSIDFYYGIQNWVSDMLEQNLTPEETAQEMAEDLGGMLEQYVRANPS